jgi:hypothetical protein
MTNRQIEQAYGPDGELLYRYDNTDPGSPTYDPAASEPDAQERIAALEQRIDAVASLADEANATAQEVAQAARDGALPGR